MGVYSPKTFKASFQPHLLHTMHSLYQPKKPTSNIINVVFLRYAFEDQGVKTETGSVWLQALEGETVALAERDNGSYI